MSEYGNNSMYHVPFILPSDLLHIKIVLDEIEVLLFQDYQRIVFPAQYKGFYQCE